MHLPSRTIHSSRKAIKFIIYYLLYLELAKAPALCHDLAPYTKYGCLRQQLTRRGEPTRKKVGWPVMTGPKDNRPEFGPERTRKRPEAREEAIRRPGQYKVHTLF